MENDSKVFGNENESNSGSLEDILQLSNRSHSARDRFKMCCRPYRIRRLKNKGALLILIWNHLVLSVFHYLILNPYVLHPSWHYITYNIIWGLTLPITGWLADVYLRRYNVICWSMFIMWIASVLVVASSVLSQFVESYYSINYYKQGGSLRSPPACTCVCLHVLLNLVRHMVWNSLCISCMESSPTMSR